LARVGGGGGGATFWARYSLWWRSPGNKAKTRDKTCGQSHKTLGGERKKIINIYRVFLRKNDLQLQA
jgi:hypothetical protein